MTAQELKQTLRSEIERRMEKHYDCLPDADSPEDDWTHNELCELGAYKELEHLDTFLDSLPDECGDFTQLPDGGGDDELKPEWSDEYNEEDLQTRFAFYTYKDGPELLFLSNLFVEESSRNQGLGTRILSAAEKVAETIGTSSIMLQSKLGTPAIRLYCKNGFELITEQGGYGWFEKKVKEPKEQNPSDIAPNQFNGITYGKQGHSTEKPEWSEEDEEMLDAMIDIVSNSLYEPLCPREGMLAWLKSLRPQPHWKPSEEQMEALEVGFKIFPKGAKYRESLENLYEQLKMI